MRLVKFLRRRLKNGQGRSGSRQLHLRRVAVVLMRTGHPHEIGSPRKALSHLHLACMLDPRAQCLDCEFPAGCMSPDLHITCVAFYHALSQETIWSNHEGRHPPCSSSWPQLTNRCANAHEAIPTLDTYCVYCSPISSMTFKHVDVTHQMNVTHRMQRLTSRTWW